MPPFAIRADPSIPGWVATNADGIEVETLTADELREIAAGRPPSDWSVREAFHVKLIRAAAADDRRAADEKLVARDDTLLYSWIP